METVFITGGARGLGLGFTQYFLKQKFKVFIGIRNPKHVPKDIEFNNNLKVVRLDAEDDRLIAQAFRIVKQETDHLNYLINNAGIYIDGVTQTQEARVNNLQKLHRSSLLKMFNINSIAPMLVIKTFLPLLNTQPAFVINISSRRGSLKDGYTNPGKNYSYGASKAALNLMTLTSIFDLPKNIKIFSVHPGDVKTDMNPTGDNNPIDQAKKIIKITKTWSDKLNGKFLNFDGSLFPT